MVYRETPGSSLRAGHTSFVLVSPVPKYGGSLRIICLFDLQKPSKIMLTFSSHLPSGGKIRLRKSKDVLCAWADSYISSRYILFQTGFFLRQLKSPHGLIGSDLLKILTSSLSISSGPTGCGGRRAATPQGTGSGPVYSQALGLRSDPGPMPVAAWHSLKGRRPHGVNLRRQSTSGSLLDPQKFP